MTAAVDVVAGVNKNGVSKKMCNCMSVLWLLDDPLLPFTYLSRGLWTAFPPLFSTWV